MRILNPLRRTVWLLSVGLALVCSCSQQTADDGAGETSEQISDPWSIGDAAVPMRDGVRLFADVYLPPGDGPFPVVLIRAPYGKRSDYTFNPAIGRFWVAHGYAFVAQDVRGRFGSEGTFEPYIRDQEIEDAYDTLEWIAAQRWCDGNIGMMGESYYGYTSLAGAWSGHPALKAISPATITVAREKQVLDGAFPLQASGLWTLSMDDVENGEYQGTGDIDLTHLPLLTMGEAHGLRDIIWRERVSGYLERPADWRDRIDAYYARVRVPALHFGGWYDTFTRGTLAIWEGVRGHSRNAAARDAQWLVMGPWDHEHVSVHLAGEPGMTRIGRLEIGGEALTTYEDLLLEFFDHTLRARENGFAQRPRVQYFTIGDNEWRTARQWPPKEMVLTPMYLRSAGETEGGAESGRLVFEAPRDEPADSYRYDPRDPVSITSDVDVWSRAGALPDRAKLLDRTDVLAYTSGPLEQPLELTGPLTLHLFASSSAPDTDFTAALVDVHPDGYNLLIQEGILRASFRDRDARPAPIVPGEVYPFPIDLWATSYVVPAGHRLRVEISSSNFPRFTRNLNTGREFGMSDEMAVAEQTVYHSAQHPSHILLPVVPR